MTDRQYFMRTFSYVRPYKFGYGIGTFIYCSQQFVFSLINSIFMGGVTAAILASSFEGVMNSIWLMVGMIAGLVIFLGFGVYMHIVYVTYAFRDFSLDIFRAFMKSSAESQKHSGEGVAAINTDADTASGIFDNALVQFLMSAMGAAFSAVAVFFIDWRMGLGVLAVGGIILFSQSRFAGPLARLGKKQLEANADGVKSLSNIIAGALTIRAYNRQDRSLIQFDKESGKLKKIAFKQAFIGMWQDVITTVQGWLTLIVVFALGGWLVIDGQIDFSTVMMVFPLAAIVSATMSQIGTTYAGLQPPIVAAKRVFAIIDSAPETANDKSEKITETGADSNYTLKINNLSFSYKDAETKALDDVSLVVGENEMVAFVGESGSGKSTLLRAIIGMYERDDMTMDIGGDPFAVDSIDNWRSHFAYVDQSCKLFDMSITENIAMGKQGKSDNSQIEEAAKRALAHDFISELPEGYETACGEKGSSLSGGQKQRIAISRALYRKAPVLVFDEATSALDADSERGIMDTIESLRSDHTVLITTHKLSNIATADKIVVMDKGHIAEIGTHTELLAKGGVYSKLIAHEQR
ncbi:MAG: ABC transporter ATP-binding protein/permease [Oscillospiraceae bacterium]|nr:ABC transporter ATP-binding protein/permease [Oscillospiraceae bacterium]MCL2278724.1 ABC transporter ATP-binding protein/permease [Oscillospiraceae bacterium]